MRLLFVPPRVQAAADLAGLSAAQSAAGGGVIVSKPLAGAASAEAKAAAEAHVSKLLAAAAAGAGGAAGDLTASAGGGLEDFTVPTIAFLRGTEGAVDIAAEYVDGFDPGIHSMLLHPDSAALPAGVTLSTAGLMEYDGTDTGADVTVANVRVAVYLSAAGDWAVRQQASGVLWTTTYETDAEVRGDETLNFSNSPSGFYNNYIYNPNLSYAGPANRNPRIYRVPGGGVAGLSCMRQEHYASDGLQMGGWRRMFVPGQADWPDDVPLYVSFMFRLPPSKFTLGSTGNQEWKVAILAGWGNSGWGSTNQDSELTLENTGDYRIMAHYTLGGQQLSVANFPNSGNFRKQNMVDRGPGFTTAQGRYCTYQEGYPTPPCFELLTNTWMQLLYRVVPRNGGNNVDIDISVNYEGGSAWTLIERYLNYSVWGPDPFNTLTFLSYSTRRGASAAMDTYQEITEVIVSTQPIEPRKVWA